MLANTLSNSSRCRFFEDAKTARTESSTVYYMANSPAFGGKPVVKRKELLCSMSLTLQASVQALSKLGLPLWVVLLRTATQIIRQFKTFVR